MAAFSDIDSSHMARALKLAARGLYTARPNPVVGCVIARGETIVGRYHGLIEAVGSGIDIPEDAWVIEGEGLTLFPGLIDSLTALGQKQADAGAARASGGAPGSAAPAIRGPEDRPQTTPWVAAADALPGVDGGARAARALEHAVVLQPAVDVVGIGHVGGQGVGLGRRDVVDVQPRGSPVVRDEQPAIIAEQDAVRVQRGR